MDNLKVPLSKPNPDISKFLDIMRGRIQPEKPPLVEYTIDDAIMRPVVEGMLGKKWINTSDLGKSLGSQINLSKDNIENVKIWLNNQIAFWYHMGYDFIRVEFGLELPADARITTDTAPAASGKNRTWNETTKGPISSWEDFEKYPWPEVKDSVFFPYEYISTHLPEGMGFMASYEAGVFEHLSRLFGYEGLCVNIMDNFDLVKEVTDKIGNIFRNYYQKLLQINNLAAIFQGDDLGFNTGTLISPEHIRELILPWHKEFAKMAHDKGLPYFLHSCGNIESVFEDLINYVGIDGKHSFQDGTAPIARAKELYGERIALLGGVDMDKLSRLEPEELRSYVRDIIDKCNIGGRFAIGAGNSIPSYIPLENYLTMLDEAFK